MAAYPSLSIGLQSTQTIEPSWRDDVSDSGTFHSRQLRSTQYYRFSLLHPAISEAEYASLLSTYAAGQRDVYTLTYREESPIATYSVQFIAPPQIVKNHGGGRFDVRVELRGSKD